MTAVEPSAQGHPTAYAVDAASSPQTSSINFSSCVTRAGNAVVPPATNGGTINVMNGSTGAVDLILDVNGYFR